MERSCVHNALFVPVGKFSKMKFIIPVCIFLLISLSATSQWRAPRLIHIGQNEGLTGTVCDMTQDSSGILYMVSELGLYTYDGAELILHQHTPEDSNSIAPNKIHSICLDKEGFVWTSHHLSGVSKFNPKTGHFTRYELPPINYSKLTGALTITDDNNDIWIGGHHGRLIKLDKKTSTFIEYQPEWIDTLKDNLRLDVISIKQDHKDHNILWLTIYGSNHDDAPLHHYGVYTFNKSTKIFTEKKCNGKISFQDTNGTLWSHYWGPLVTAYNPYADECVVYDYDSLMMAKDIIKGAAVSHDIVQWNNKKIIATNGLVSMNQDDSMEELITSQQDEVINSAYVDKDENLWFSFDNGVNILRPVDQYIDYFSIEMFEKVSGRIYPGRIAYHPHEEKIYLLNPQGKERDRIYSIPIDKSQTPSYISTNYNLSGITIDSTGQIWLYASSKLFTLDNDRMRLVHSKKNVLNSNGAYQVYYLKTSSDGVIGGISKDLFFWYKPNENTYDDFSFDSLLFDGKGDIFSGFQFLNDHKVLLFTNLKVFELDIQSEQVIELSISYKFVDSVFDIRNAFKAENGSYWINNLSHLSHFIRIEDSLKLVKTYTNQDGILSPTMHQTFEDINNNIWIFSNSGINCLNPSSNEIRAYGIAEGLPMNYNDPLQIAATSEGILASISHKGFMLWNPDSLWSSKAPPDVDVIIKSIKSNGVKQNVIVKERDHYEIHLNGRTQVLDIDFHGVSMYDSRLLNYSYNLNGDWVQLGNNNNLTLTNIDYGKTILKLTTSSIDAQIKKITQLIINVPVPIYARSWFKMLIGLMLLLTTYFIARWSISTEQKKKKDKYRIEQQIVELELKALRAQMNPHFLFNSLNSIKAYILEAKPEIAADYLSQFGHLIRNILQNSRERYISLHNELQTLKLYISLEMFRFENRFSVEYHIDDFIAFEDINIPPLLLQPYVENAIWHGLLNIDDGVLIISIKDYDKHVECIIDDNGIGRQKSKQLKSLSANKHKSLGMKITQNRIMLQNSYKQFNLKIKVVDKVNSDNMGIGTTIHIIIPKQIP